MSNHHIIEQILASADIVKIIGKHVELKRSGNEFKGCCPFHGEKTPSFFVNPQKNLYNCFGCGVKGNALTFLKEYENLTAGEALKELSRQTGIELPKETVKKDHTYQRTPVSAPQLASIPVSSDSSLTNVTSNSNILSSSVTDIPASLSLPQITVPVSFEQDLVPADNWITQAQDAQSYSFEDYQNDFDIGLSYEADFNVGYDADIIQLDDGSSSLYDLLNQVAKFYQQQLTLNPIAQQYFMGRGLSDKTIQEFGLGYAPPGWQHLEQAFPRDIEGLKVLGLLRSSQKGNDYNLLRHRVIFPIRDNQGRVVGFAGRALSDEEQPKYINSSDSPVFHKQQILYGLYEGRLAKAKDWLVVEGYMDVISLHQAGVYGAVASMGTAIATSQIEKLLQLNSTLTLSFDGDSAGQKAAWRAMEVGLPALTDGKELRFLTLPDNHDPDSFVKSHGAAAMQAQIRQAVPLSQYLFISLTRRYEGNSAEHRSKILKELYQLTQKLPKGSYGWLLRDDIKSRLGLGRKQQARQAQDALLSFTTQLTLHLQLQLCFLYQPELLGTLYHQTINQQFITQIYETSRCFCVFIPNKKQKTAKSLDDASTHRAFAHLMFEPKKFNLLGWQRLQIDDKSNVKIAYHLLTKFYADKFVKWQDMVDADTLKLIAWIQQIQPELVKIDQKNLGEFERINAKAHFILAGLPTDLQRYLARHWLAFFNSLSQRLVTDVSMLIGEVVLKLMLESLDNKRDGLKGDLHNLTICNRHYQALAAWQRQWLQQQETIN